MLSWRAPYPLAVFQEPSVLEVRALAPLAVFSSPVVMEARPGLRYSCWCRFQGPSRRPTLRHHRGTVRAPCPSPLGVLQSAQLCRNRRLQRLDVSREGGELRALGRRH